MKALSPTRLCLDCAHCCGVRCCNVSPQTPAHLQVSEGTLRLRLPDLRRAMFDGVFRDQMELPDTPASLLLDRDSFKDAAKVETLEICTYGTLTLLPDCFTALTALHTLRLYDCGLANIPAALTALAGSLTSLTVSYTTELQLDSDVVATLLLLRTLRKLHLPKTSLSTAMRDSGTAAADVLEAHLGFQPALWTTRSLQHLVELPGAFLAQNGHALALHLENAQNL